MVNLDDPEGQRVLRCLRRKYKISKSFVNYNLTKICRTITYVESLRVGYAIRAVRRKRRRPRVFLVYNYAVPWVMTRTGKQRKRLKQRRQHIRIWSKKMVNYLRAKFKVLESDENPPMEKVRTEVKKQLRLLNTGKREVDLLGQITNAELLKKRQSTMAHYVHNECLNELQVTSENLSNWLVAAVAIENNNSDISTSLSTDENVTPEKTALTPGSGFIDKLMTKANVKSIKSIASNAAKSKQQEAEKQQEVGHHTDTSEECYGFDELEHQPGMLSTPLVSKKMNNNVFVSEALNQYLLDNATCISDNSCATPKPTATMTKQTARVFPANKIKIKQTSDREGLVMIGCKQPHLPTPAVPDTLLKLRTVAERRQFFQKNGRNTKLAIINNELMIGREMERKMRLRKSKSAAQTNYQSSNSCMPFTRQGWQAASFVNTEFNRYYFQKLLVLPDNLYVKLPGVRGNNLIRDKPTHVNKTTAASKCFARCVDKLVSTQFRAIQKPNHLLQQRMRLHTQLVSRSFFKPCPLSHKVKQLQCHQDDLPWLAAGLKVLLMNMPTMRLEVHPAIGKSFPDRLKPYLDYYLGPNQVVSPQWAEYACSVLVHPAPTSKYRKSQESSKTLAANKNAESQSVTFRVPYMNDRQRVLMLEIANRTETLDASFKIIENKEILRKQHGFYATVNQRNNSDVECANVLADLIDCTVISCAENSITNGFCDDGNEEEQQQQETTKSNQKDAKKSKRKDAAAAACKVNKKQMRLLNELKRLNATVIDAHDDTEKTNKPCGFDYCRLGCICPREYAKQVHCGKADCMFECKCKRSTATGNIIRFDAEGRSITTEDAFKLRQQATARLARMEKEFTSTVVLTDNETLLINDSQYDKKRRCTKAPKRYDFAESSAAAVADDNSASSANKSMVCLDHNNSGSAGIDKELHAAGGSSIQTTTTAYATELKEPVYVQQDVLQKLKHCTVNLTRLQHMDNMVSWCMVHELYKCFCGGQALQGKAMVIEKEAANTCIAESTDITMTNKTHNLLDATAAEAAANNMQQLEELQEVRVAQDQNDSVITLLNSNSSSSDNDDDDIEIAADNDVDDAAVLANDKQDFVFYFSAKASSCRRILPIPFKAYFRSCKRKAQQNRKIMLHTETTESNYQLVSKVMKCIQNHRTVRKTRKLEEARKCAAAENAQGEHAEIDPTPHKKAKIMHDVTAAAAEECAMVDLTADAEDDDDGNAVDATEVATNNPQQTTDLPRILNCYSLNTNSSDSGDNSKEIDLLLKSLETSNDDNAEAATAASTTATATPTTTAVALQTSQIVGSTNMMQQNNPQFREFYNGIIKNMNFLVSKKMQDIDMALKRDSPNLPKPNEDVLCIIEWSKFLRGFRNDFIHMWQVKMLDYNMLAATSEHQLPAVRNAVGVMKINAVREDTLPFLARLLLTNYNTESMSKLAVVLQGRSNFWVVNGMMLSHVTLACPKPTPRTHPVLTTKINELCALMVQQRYREAQRRDELNKRVAAAAAAAASEEAATIIAQNQLANMNGIINQQQQQQQQQKQVQIHSHSTTLPPSRSVATATQKLALKSANVRPGITVWQPKQTANATSNNSTSTTQQQLSKLVQRQQSPLRSNIEFRRVTQTDILKVQQPEINHRDHRWLVLDLQSDFSHIYVPDFHDSIALERILKVAKYSRENNKIVKLQFKQNLTFHAFVTPTSSNFLYFGPLMMTNAVPPVLILLQSVDNCLVTREVYEDMRRIKNDKRTMAFWLHQINGRVHFQYDDATTGGCAATIPMLTLLNNANAMQAMPAAVTAATAATNNAEHADLLPNNNTNENATNVADNINDDDDSDDCIIIDDDEPATTTTPAAVATTTSNSLVTATQTAPNANDGYSFAIEASGDNLHHLLITNLNGNKAAAPLNAAKVSLPPIGSLLSLPLQQKCTATKPITIVVPSAATLEAHTVAKQLNAASSAMKTVVRADAVALPSLHKGIKRRRLTIAADSLTAIYPAAASISKTATSTAATDIATAAIAISSATTATTATSKALTANALTSKAATVLTSTANKSTAATATVNTLTTTTATATTLTTATSSAATLRSIAKAANMRNKVKTLFLLNDNEIISSPKQLTQTEIINKPTTSNCSQVKVIDVNLDIDEPSASVLFKPVATAATKTKQQAAEQQQNVINELLAEHQHQQQQQNQLPVDKNIEIIQHELPENPEQITNNTNDDEACTAKKQPRLCSESHGGLTAVEATALKCKNIAELMSTKTMSKLQQNVGVIMGSSTIKQATPTSSSTTETKKIILKTPATSLTVTPLTVSKSSSSMNTTHSTKFILPNNLKRIIVPGCAAGGVDKTYRVLCKSDVNNVSFGTSTGTAILSMKDGCFYGQTAGSNMPPTKLLRAVNVGNTTPTSNTTTMALDNTMKRALNFNKITTTAAATTATTSTQNVIVSNVNKVGCITATIAGNPMKNKVYIRRAIVAGTTATATTAHNTITISKNKSNYGFITATANSTNKNSVTTLTTKVTTARTTTTAAAATATTTTAAIKKPIYKLRAANAIPQQKQQQQIVRLPTATASLPTIADINNQQPTPKIGKIISTTAVASQFSMNGAGVDGNAKTPAAAASVNKINDISSNQQNAKEGYYGFFTTTNPKLPRFVGRCLHDEYVIKAPNIGLMRMKCLESCNIFLNKHVLKIHPKFADVLPLPWKFTVCDITKNKMVKNAFTAAAKTAISANAAINDLDNSIITIDDDD